MFLLSLGEAHPLLQYSLLLIINVWKLTKLLLCIPPPLQSFDMNVWHERLITVVENLLQSRDVIGL